MDAGSSRGKGGGRGPLSSKATKNASTLFCNLTVKRSAMQKKTDGTTKGRIEQTSIREKMRRTQIEAAGKCVCGGVGMSVDDC
jgi:hypothetical protein